MNFDDIEVGDSAELTHTISQDDIDRFVELSGDDNKLHVDREYASRTRLKKPVAHGILGVSFISTVIGTKLPGDGALWFAQNLEFLLPVRVGDEITVRAEVIAKNPRRRVVEMHTDIFNQNKQKVTSGTAKVRIVEVEEEKLAETARRAKVALVVGGTGGIGRASCLQLVRDGFDVAVLYHQNDDAAARLSEEIEQLGRKAVLVKADITACDQVEEGVSRVLRQLGGLSAMVHCATVNVANMKLADLKWHDMERHLDINVKGFFHLLKAVVPIMEEQAYGKIVTITTKGIEHPDSGLTHYITAKSALYGMAKSLAIDLGPKGINVNIVSPGMADTDLIADLPEKVRLLTESQTPLRRLASPDDVAGAISFLVSDKSDFMTGETLRVNGGQVML